MNQLPLPIDYAQFVCICDPRNFDQLHQQKIRCQSKPCHLNRNILPPINTKYLACAVAHCTKRFQCTDFTNSFIIIKYLTCTEGELDILYITKRETIHILFLCERLLYILELEANAETFIGIYMPCALKVGEISKSIVCLRPKVEDTKSSNN